MFQRCVIAVIGVLAISTSAVAGPIKLGEAPSLNIDELTASGAKMDDTELRALFFRGAGSRHAAASCAECLAAGSSLHARQGASSDFDAFPFTAASVFPRGNSGKNSGKSSAHTGQSSHPAAISDPTAVALLPPLSSSEAVAPVAIITPEAVPEPSTVVLVASGLAGAWLVRRRRRQA